MIHLSQQDQLRHAIEAIPDDGVLLEARTELLRRLEIETEHQVAVLARPFVGRVLADAGNERQAAPLSNIIVFPMMFLSGTFFPRFLMPEWLQNVTGYLPLTPVVDGLRYIVNEGYTLSQLVPQLSMMAVWTIVIYIIAFKVFRWE